MMYNSTKNGILASSDWIYNDSLVCNLNLCSLSTYMSDLFLYNYCMVLSLHICLSIIHFHAEYQLAQTGKYKGLWCVYMSCKCGLKGGLYEMLMAVSLAIACISHNRQLDLLQKIQHCNIPRYPTIVNNSLLNF